MSEQVDVAHVANLARLKLTDEEISRFQREINDILAYIDSLKEVDVDGIEPTAHASAISNVIREDVAGDCQDIDRTLKNAPEEDDDLIAVPNVLPGEEGA